MKALWQSMAVAAIVLWSACAAAQAQPAGDQPAAQAQAAKPDPAILDGEGRKAAEAALGGDHAEAARRYKVLLDTRGPDPVLLYNLGTSWAQTDELGKALWALERARLRAPSDGAIKQNLEIIRQRVRVARMSQKVRGRLTQGDPEGVFWVRLLTSFGWWWLLGPLVLGNLLFFVFLGLRRSSPEGGVRDAWTVGAGVMAVLVLLALVGVVARQAVVDSVTVGVVLGKGVGLSDNPAPTTVGRPHIDMYQGAVVRVLTQREDGWFQIQLVDGTLGWVRQQHVGLVD